MTDPAPRSPLEPVFRQITLYAFGATIFLLFVTPKNTSYFPYVMMVSGGCTALLLILWSATRLFENVIAKIRFQLLELLFIVIVLGNALGWTASALLNQNPGSYYDHWVFGFAALGIVLLLGGGSLWGLWVASLLEMKGLGKRIGLQFMGWLVIPAGIAILFGLLALAVGVVDKKLNSFLVGLAVTIPSGLILFYARRFTARANVARKN